MIDFHSHILPEMDDGSRNIRQSIHMLQINAQNGVETLLASPHFYLSQEEIKSFLARREEAFWRLNEAAEKTGAKKPGIVPGAEVLLVNDLLDLPDLEALCIGGTRYMLLELPYDFWTEWVFQAVFMLIGKKKIIPIIAHVDRYPWVIKEPNCLLPLIGMGAVLQMNADMLLNVRTKSLGLQMLKHRFIHVLGSDAHGEKFRPPNLWQAFDIIQKSLGEEAVRRIFLLEEQILANERLELPEVQPLRKGWLGWR